MSWFSRRTPAPRTAPPVPISTQRVAESLDRYGYSYSRDDDGDYTGLWDGNRFWLMLLGENDEVLQVRGRWHRSLSMERRAAVRLALNDWNRDHVLPKVYCQEDGERIGVYAEHSIDYDAGASDEQIDATIRCGLATGVQFFEQFELAFPSGTALDEG